MRFIAIPLAALALAGCAAITEQTGVTVEEQTCVAVYLASAPADMPVADKLRAANLACFIAPGTPGAVAVAE